MLPGAPASASGFQSPIDRRSIGVAHVLHRVTVSSSDNLDWLPAEGIHLSRERLARIFIALRALVGGTDAAEPSRSHAYSIASLLADAIDQTGGEQ